MEDIVQHFFKFAYIKTPQSEGKLKGLVICATGFRDQALFSQIKENGGTIADSLTKSVNCLIVKDLNSKSSKVQKAEKNGIEILDINEFMKKYMV
jgi:DNA ligase (NAD+)